MCGVVGFAGEPNPELLFALMRESNIRGQHATGVSFVSSSGAMETHIRPGDAASFLSSPPKGLAEARLVIAHSRYSTSDLKYSQPLFDENAKASVVHNGVISQEPPEKWAKLFGYECVTRNDSELVLRAYISGTHPMLAFPKGSIAACVLDASPEVPRIEFFRNGKRPLWFVKRKNEIFVASTQNALSRAGILRAGGAGECLVGETYLAFADGTTQVRQLEIPPHLDLQHAQV